MVWMYGSMLVALSGLVVEVIMWYARDGASQSDDASAAAAFALIESDMVEYAAMSTAVSLQLYMERANWMTAQWMLLDDEQKEAWFGDMMEEDEEMPESLISLFF